MIDQHTLYVDNFRGFRDAYVPIADVNFLVGENSSGKTSLLSLLKLMSEERLLIESQFLADDVDLGTFDDIVSAHTEDSSYFRIGMIRWDTTAKAKMPMAMLVTYEKHEGLPRDVSFTCSFESKEVVLRRVGKEFHFRTRDRAISVDTDIRRLFAAWIDEHRRPNGDFKKLDFPFSSEQSLLFPLSLVAQNACLSKKPSRLPLLTPMVFPSTAWVAPIRTKPRRTYDELRRGFSSEGTHTPYLIRKLLDSEPQAKRFRNIIHEVGKGSGLFERVDIHRFGKDITSPFEIHIVLGEKAFNLVNVGYGVSQALPVVVEILWRRPGTWFSIQQPEVHLHPRAQAALGDLIFTMAVSEKKKFLIETHSDFMIDRYRKRFRRTKINKPSSQILFFERKNNRHNTVTPLTINEQGELPTEQPKGYRRFFIKEQMELLGL
jgi:AAA domain, putative AbiEii toxin, Type IV TA system